METMATTTIRWDWHIEHADGRDTGECGTCGTREAAIAEAEEALTGFTPRHRRWAVVREMAYDVLPDGELGNGSSTGRPGTMID